MFTGDQTILRLSGAFHDTFFLRACDVDADAFSGFWYFFGSSRS